MPTRPSIRRLGLIPASAPDDPLRRYRLARLEEVAFSTPPDRSTRPPVEPAGDVVAPSDPPESLR